MIQQAFRQNAYQPDGDCADLVGLKTETLLTNTFTRRGFDLTRTFVDVDTEKAEDDFEEVFLTVFDDAEFEFVVVDDELFADVDTVLTFPNC